MALGIACVLAAGLTLLPLSSLVAGRFSGSPAHAEEFSGIARVWLAGQALDLVREHPLTGVGAGGFVLALAERAGVGYIVEPVHSLPLLAAAELGLPGLLVLLGLGWVLARGIAETTRPEGILVGAAVAGLAVAGLFDHYMWTLAPGRLLLGLAIGLWAAQEKTG